MPNHARPTRSRRIPGGHRFAALAISLPLSAALTAAAVESSDLSWLAWMSLLPLFWAIRSLKPVGAMLSGALWGGCLAAFLVAGPAPAISPAFSSLALLAAVPALYAGICSRLTRSIGFNPIMLGLGWILVEVALKPVGLRHGLLASTLADGSAVLWIGRLLGSVFVAALVVCANASLLAVLSSTRLRFRSNRSSAAPLPSAPGFLSWQTSFLVQHPGLRQMYPRAPPPQLASQE